MHAVPTTILEQLGDGKFVAMTGAKDFVGSENALSFRVVGRCNGHRINKVKISLAADDTYGVQVFAMRNHGLDLKLIGWRLDVYVSQLSKTFEQLTGLRASLD